MPRHCSFGCVPGTPPMHRFPNLNKCPERFKTWVNLVGGKLETESDYASYREKRVCDRHFTDQERNRCGRLNVQAVPSLHLGTSPQKADSGHNVVSDDEVLDNDCQNVADAPILVDLDDDCHVVSDDDELLLYPSATKEDDNKTNLDEVDELHDGFKCNFCSGVIKGFRYTCVQCSDYDLCGSCEENGAHCAHYVLRIPSPRPFAEIESVLGEIRKQLLCGVWKQADTQADAAPDTEIKEEAEDEDDLDPLRSDDATSAPRARPARRSSHTGTDEDWAVPQAKVKKRQIKAPRTAKNKQKQTATKKKNTNERKHDVVLTTLNTVQKATRTSALPGIPILGKHDVDNDTSKKSFQVLSDTILPSKNTVDVASSTSNKVQIPGNAKSKIKLEDVSKRVLVLQNNAMETMKVLLVPLSKRRKLLTSAGTCDLSTGETTTAGLNPGVTTPVRIRVGAQSATPPPPQDLTNITLI